MIFKFIMISDEVDEFVREIHISPEATFLDFHQIILQSVGYKDDQMTSFFLCDEDWEKQQEVTLEAMDYGSEEDNYVMKDTKLSELLEDEKQKLIYIFDPLSERCFFIELTEIIPVKEVKKPTCAHKSGDAPKQMAEMDTFATHFRSSEDLGENFYGDESYNADDFDPEGFDIPAGDISVDDLENY